MATGAKLANHDLPILVHMGDGDCYGEGGNHLLAALRRNIDLTLVVHNNMVYGLTKGQASPPPGMICHQAQPEAWPASIIPALALSQARDLWPGDTARTSTS